jgi:hypothetical protein
LLLRRAGTTRHESGSAFVDVADDEEVREDSADEP